ncbi:DUF5999 family protein [Streptomyces cyaneofuscatus]|uniref:DUF5999 family protein n=1 Tax=Streptomyces cyaneofuscatus TaxID=66883 RepID=UPI0033A6B61B
MCPHTPPCPPADQPDGEGAKVVDRDSGVGFARLCNGITMFEDTGGLRPDGKIIAPSRVASLTRPLRGTLAA